MNIDHDLIASGTAVATSDSNLLITLTTCTGTNCATPDPSVGVNGVETLDAVLVTTSKSLITEFDTSATSSGELDAQTVPSAVCPTAPTTPCGFAFFTTGVSSSGTTHTQMSIGGVINVDQASGGISGAGSVCSASSVPADRLHALGPVEYLGCVFHPRLFPVCP